MTTYSRVTEIFCLVDEFCKGHDQVVEKHLLGSPSKRPSIMSKSEVITITILFQLSGFRTFKHFYVFYVQKHMKDDFPKTVSYNRFTGLMQQGLMPMALFLKTCCLGRLHRNIFCGFHTSYTNLNLYCRIKCIYAVVISRD